MEQTLFDKLISHFGDQTRAAEALETTPQVINNWKRRGIPVDWALPIENKTRGFITAKDVLQERLQ